MMTATFATPLSMLYHIPVDIITQITCWILEIKTFLFCSTEETILPEHLPQHFHKILLYYDTFMDFMSFTVCWIPTNVFGSCCHWSSQLSHKFLSIKSYFDDVVEQSKERSQGEGCDEQRHKTKLDDWMLNKTEEYIGKSPVTVSLSDS